MNIRMPSPKPMEIPPDIEERKAEKEFIENLLDDVDLTADEIEVLEKIKRQLESPHPGRGVKLNENDKRTLDGLFARKNIQIYPYWIEQK